MTQDRIETLAEEISDFKPDIILTHWKNEVTYPTHWVTSDSVMKAAQLAHLRTESTVASLRMGLTVLSICRYCRRNASLFRKFGSNLRP